MKKSDVLLAVIAAGSLLTGCVTTTTTTSAEGEADEENAAALNYQLGARYFRAGNYELARDRHAQAGARLGANQVVIGTEELFLQPGHLLGRHADTGITDCHAADRSRLRRGGSVDRPGCTDRRALHA